MTVSPSKGLVTIDPATGAGSAQLTVSAAAGTPHGFYTVRFSFITAAGEKLAERDLLVSVAPPGSLRSMYDNVGISDDNGTHDEANYDGGGFSYSKQALAAAGLAPGAEVTIAGLTFTWPDSPRGMPDNVRAAGQTLDLSWVPPSATKLSFVGSSTGGNRAATAPLTYTDGTTETIDLSFSDWTLGGGSGSVQFDNFVVAQTPYRNRNGTDSDTVKTYVFATSPFTIPTGKKVKSVTLPVNTGIHIFSVATG